MVVAILAMTKKSAKNPKREAEPASASSDMPKRAKKMQSGNCVCELCGSSSQDLKWHSMPAMLWAVRVCDSVWPFWLQTITSLKGPQGCFLRQN